MIRTFFKVFCIMLLPMLLTGCWNYKDIDRKSIVLSAGVDMVNDMLEFTGEIAKLTTVSRKAEITEVYKFSSLGKYFEGSRDNFDAKITAPDFSGALRSVIFSKRYAETEGIESYINRFYYIADFRNSAAVAVCEEPTKEFFSGKIKNDIAIGYAVENTIKTLSNNGATLYKTLQQVKSDIEFKNIGFLLPYVANKNDIVEYLGLAAIKDSKLIDTIKREDCNGFIFILSKKPVSEIPIPHPADKSILVSIKNTLKQRKIKTDYKNNKVNIYIDLKLNSQIRYLYEYKTISSDDIKKLEEAISDEMKKGIILALELSKSQLKCDVFGFARYFKADNPHEYKKLNWEEEYPHVNFYVNVKTTIINTNLIDVNVKKAR